KFLIISGLLFSFQIDGFCQLNVNYISAQQFVQNLVGPNISFSNAVFSGTDYTQVASFSGSTIPNIGIPVGVALVSGDAMILADTSHDFAAGNALGGGGDADLSGACQQPTKDLAAVEFDFSSPTDSVEFTFMFASEEYNYWEANMN